ncbi:hypothetical protein [Polaribacter sp.]|uniref:hypothetical protein n=1 Tax=Polaribacter sp. TaxID=1920175 RepID=UPI004047EEC2
MSTNQPQKSNEEEVDLGSLFVIIGRGFSKFFNFIGSIFKGIFHTVILFLIFIKENIKKIGIAAILGMSVGIFIELQSPKRYASELLIEPNFKSVLQLYNNVNYYNDLVQQKDTLKLQETFNLTKDESASLREFEIEPLKVDSDIINAYDELILSVDSLTLRSYDYEDFRASFTTYDYKVHKVTVIAEMSNVFDKLDDVIISSIEKNKYFNRLKELTNENLNRTDSVYKESLAQTDSLRKVYMQVLLDEAKKESNGTNIDFGGDKQTIKELELFETNRKINYDLRNLAEEKSKKYEVINVISNFQPVGYEIKGVTKNYGFLFGITGASVMIFFLLLLKLNVYLDNYKK